MCTDESFVKSEVDYDEELFSGINRNAFKFTVVLNCEIPTCSGTVGKFTDTVLIYHITEIYSQLT